MPEEAEIETKELQETIEELHEERKEREEAERRSAWTRYIAITTAILAVFAAIAAMQSGALVNEAMMSQLKASDTWNEYQADRLKSHLYGIAANGMVDSGVKPAVAKKEAGEGGTRAAAGAGRSAKNDAPKEGTAGEAKAPKEKKAQADLKALPPPKRLGAYVNQIEKEEEKAKDLSKEAKKLEEESAHTMRLHHQFALAVAFTQVAIALSAVAALTRMKWIWGVSLLAGLVGIAYFAQGFLAH